MRTFTGGQGQSGPRLYAALVRHHLGQSSTHGRNAAVYFRQLSRLMREHGEDIRGARILEVGCGGRAGTLLAFHSAGARITGIDYDLISPQPSLSGFVASARRSGLERAGKTLGRQLLFDRAYYAALEEELGRKLDRTGLDLRTMDACDLRFGDDEFDLVYSSAVFEHIHDVDAAAREIARVLKPDGIASIGVHLFPSLTGGHALNAGVPPWDHLRERRFPAHVFLNELRADDYREAFGRCFQTTDEERLTEGEELLTDDVRSELVGWSVEDLTTCRLTLTLRPLGVGSRPRD